MTKYSSVPRLDLAPKLKRPLSLKNPLDYLRLLYWVFLFPQALRWYVDRFGGDWNSIQQLLIQGLLLALLVLLSIVVVLFTLHFPFDLTIMLQGMTLGLVGGVILGFMTLTIAGCVVGGMTGGVAAFMVGGLAGDMISKFISIAASDIPSNTISDLASHVMSGIASGLAFGVLLGVVLGVTLSVVFSVVSGVASSVQLSIMPGVLLCVLTSVVLGGTFSFQVLSNAVFSSALPKAKDLVMSIAFSIACIVQSLAIVRLDNWLIGALFNIRTIENVSVLLPRTTLLPLPNLAQRLQNWLEQDWETGLYNANQLLAYTLQFIPVVQAVNKVLAKTPSEQIIWRVSLLAANPFDWKLVGFASASLFKFFLDPPDELSFYPTRIETRLDTYVHATAAGFWYLHQKEPAKATEAFAVVRSLLYGDEMYTLAQTLEAFNKAQKPDTIASLQVPNFPQETPLRPDTWRVFSSLRRVVEDIQFVNRSISRSARSLALNRALGELTKILNEADTLPQAEQGLIIDIAQTWKESLLQIAGKVGDISITKPVINPYVAGDPVQGNLFVGREDALRQLEELWVLGNQLQSVVLYGHRRMGKTSILLNAGNFLGSGLRLAYINLLRLGDSPQGVGEVLMAICDEISQTVELPPPTDADLLNLPYRTFERYLKHVEAKLEGGLIIALDEFEKIEELIESGKIPVDFMGFLRGLVQMNSKISFAFAGLHTLEEMTADYFQPFFASVIPIHVGFQQRTATRQILANPGNKDFPLDYIPEALDEIYALTHGQPYLVQLMGFQLVRRYNDFVFEQGQRRDSVFTLEDVEAVINNPEFFQRGRYYFDGVWGQAARGAEGQQAIVQVLARHPEGLSLDALAQSTGMNDGDLQEALNTLKRHDVVEETQGKWRIMVELFRRWVLR
ncbi:ATP-binding protein [Nostoc sp. FACHB-973]|nr:ATP-binding protein [Nostoc sp. FACHB-973]